MDRNEKLSGQEAKPAILQGVLDAWVALPDKSQVEAYKRIRGNLLLRRLLIELPQQANPPTPAPQPTTSLTAALKSHGFEIQGISLSPNGSLLLELQPIAAMGT